MELAGSEPVKCGLTIILRLYAVIGYYNYTNLIINASLPTHTSTEYCRA